VSGHTRRFLLAMWEGGGTVPPELGVAHRLLARGHQVHVLGDPTIAERAISLGCTFSPWMRAPHRTSLDPAQDLLKDWEVSNPLAMLRNARDRFMVGPAGEFAHDTRETIAAVRPDVLLADVMLLGAVIAGQAARLPIAALKPNIWMIPSPGVPAIGPGFPPARSVLGRTRDAAMRTIANRLFDRGLPALNAIRAEHGLQPLASFWDQILDVDRIMVLTSPTFDFAAPHVPAHARYVGPVLDDPPWAEPWVPPWADDDPRPLVLVAFTSTYQDHGPQLRRITEVLSNMPVRAIVTLGQMLDDHEVTPTGNVAVVRSAPHSQILPRAALVISHCGHGTTLKSLAAGIPLVCIPMGRDQNDTAARVIHHGAGMRLRPSASPAQIRRAVAAVLHDGRFRANAERLAKIIAHEQQTTGPVVTQLEELADAVPNEPAT
jgi:MGT family glycosyltransferase